MTQKERLVEDVKLQIFSALGKVNCDTCIYKDYDMEPCRLCHIKYNQWAISKDTLQNLAESIVKRAIKNGVIVPPCKVGDVVYRLNVDCTQLCDFDCDDDCYHCKYRVANIYDVLLDGLRKVLTAMEWWGKYYFPTREAAEQALKERETK